MGQQVQSLYMLPAQAVGVSDLIVLGTVVNSSISELTIRVDRVLRGDVLRTSDIVVQVPSRSFEPGDRKYFFIVASPAPRLVSFLSSLRPVERLMAGLSPWDAEMSAEQLKALYTQSDIVASVRLEPVSPNSANVVFLEFLKGQDRVRDHNQEIVFVDANSSEPGGAWRFMDAETHSKNSGLAYLFLASRGERLVVLNPTDPTSVTDVQIWNMIRSFPDLAVDSDFLTSSESD